MCWPRWGRRCGHGNGLPNSNRPRWRCCGRSVIETGRISAAGTLAPLLHGQQHPAVYDGGPTHHRDDTDPTTTLWQAAMTSIRDVIGIARHDPGTARQLLALLTCYTRNDLAYSRIREELIETGIPAELLPTRDQAACSG